MKKFDEGIIFSLAKQLEKDIEENKVDIGSLPNEDILKIVHQYDKIKSLLNYLRP